MDDTAACAAALVLAFAGESSLRTAYKELVRLAGELEQAAGAANAPYKGLAAVTRMVSDADDTSKVEAVEMLEKTVMTLEQAADAAARLPRDTSERASQDRAQAISRLDQEGTALGTLACTAHRLARACQDYRRVADAIPLVRRAAAEAERARHAAAEAERAWHAATEAEQTRQQQRSKDAASTSHTGRWWYCLGRRRPGGRPNDIENPLIQRSDPATPSPSATTSIELGAHGQGDDKRSGMMGYGLFGSIGLIPYLGPDKVAKKVELLSDNDKLFLHICVCLWWTLVALGAPCSAYAQSLFERVCALFSSRLGILGMNIVVILFMYCVLDLDYKRALYWMLGTVCIPHVVLFIAACRRRHF